MAAVLLLIAALGYFRALIPVSQVVLAAAVLINSKLIPQWPRLTITDYLSLTLALTGLARLLFQPFALGIGQTVSLITGVLLYWSIRTIHYRRAVFRVTALLLGLGGGILCIVWLLRAHAWSLTVRGGGFDDVTGLKARLFSPWGGLLNEWASVLGLLVPFSLLNLRPVRAVAPGPLLFSCTVCFVTIAALFFTFSRTAYVGLLVVIAGLFAGTVALVRDRSALLKWAAPVILVAVASAIATNILSGGAVLRTAKIASTEQQRRSASGRFQVWSGAVEIAASHWALGSGPGTFAMQYVPSVKIEEGQSFVGRPLNTAVGLLVEEGIVGFALHVLLAAAAIGVAIRRIGRLPSGRAYAVAGLAIAVSVFWIREMIFSSLLEEPLVMSLYWISLAFLVTLSAPRAREAPMKRNRMRAALLLLGLSSGALFALGWQWRSFESSARAAAVRMNQGASDAIPPTPGLILGHRSVFSVSLRALATGLRSVPPFDPASPFPVAQSASEREQLAAALSDYDRAIELNPNDDLFWHNRAIIRLTLGVLPAETFGDLQRAIRIDGASEPYRVALGLLYERNGNVRLALEQYAATIAAAPAILDSRFARDLQRRAPELWQTAIRAAIGRLEVLDPRATNMVLQARLARIYLEDGQRDRAEAIIRSVVKAMPQYSRPWITLARLEWSANSFDAAENSLRKGRFLDPADPIGWAMAARLARHSGDEDLAVTSEQRGDASAQRPISSHARRVNRVYKTGAVVRDDVLPPGLLAYCSPSPGAMSRP